MKDDMGWKELYHMQINEIKLPILPENFKEMIQMDNKKYDTFGKSKECCLGKKSCTHGRLVPTFRAMERFRQLSVKRQLKGSFKETMIKIQIQLSLSTLY